MGSSIYVYLFDTARGCWCREVYMVSFYYNVYDNKAGELMNEVL